MGSEWFVVLAAVALTLGLRTYRHPVLQKLSIFALIGTSMLIGWALTRSVLIAFLCGLTWILLPWLELLTRVRRIRLPEEKRLRPSSPPDEELFPDADSVSGQLTEAGFEFIEDLNWRWEEQMHLYRVHYHPGRRAYAMLCCIQQEPMTFSYLTVASRKEDGSLMMTWNFPFPQSLLLPPHITVQRTAFDDTVEEMCDQHHHWLAGSGMPPESFPEQTTETLQAGTEEDLRLQVEHNLQMGILIKTTDGAIRYTRKGLMFLWLQFLREFVKL